MRGFLVGRPRGMLEEADMSWLRMSGAPTDSQS
jgi:hypothetical protein